MPDNQQLLEGLVPAGLFGPPKLRTCVGLFIAPDSVSLAAAALSGGRPSVSKVVTVPLAKPPVPEGEAAKKRGFFNTEFLVGKDAVAQAISSGLTELGARSKDVVVTLSHQLSITRYFLMNPVDKRFWKTSVPLEAKKYIPFPLEGLMNDYQVTPAVSESKKNLMGVLFGVTPQLALNQVLGIVRGLGLNPVAVEPSHASVMRLWHAAGALGGDGQAQIRVHFDSERAYVILTRAGLPLLCREVELPADEYALSQKKLDLASAVDFAERYLGIEGVAAVKVTGVGDLAQRTGMVTREVSLAVEKDASVELPGGGSPQWGPFAAAGAALRSLGASPIALDFTQTGRMREEDKTLILIWGVGLAAFLLFTLGALVNEFQIVRAKQELARLTRRAAEAGVTQGLSAGDLKAKLDRMKALVTAMETMDGHGALAPKLQALVDDIPPGVWLENVAYSDGLVPGEPSKKRVTVAGAAQYGSRENDILAANQFKETLSKDPLFAAGFGKLDISFSGGAAGEPGTGGGGKKTSFSLVAAPER